MQNIDIAQLRRRLLLTQEYCERQLAYTGKSPATILRSINPRVNNRPIFQFYQQKIRYVPPVITATKWHTDMVGTPQLIDGLFERQAAFKQLVVSQLNHDIDYRGEILVFDIDGTLTDGVAEIESMGLLDVYNCPPIDTWFYMGYNNGSRILLAWIPEPFVQLADGGIAVNPEGCIDWLKTWSPAIAAAISLPNF